MLMGDQETLTVTCRFWLFMRNSCVGGTRVARRLTKLSICCSLKRKLALTSWTNSSHGAKDSAVEGRSFQCQKRKQSLSTQSSQAELAAACLAPARFRRVRRACLGDPRQHRSIHGDVNTVRQRSGGGRTKSQNGSASSRKSVFRVWFETNATRRQTLLLSAL